jgi:hypothetical protein
MENNYEPFPYENSLEENKRPGFLTFLCVLTFIGSGFSLLSQLLMPVIAPISLEFFQGSSFASAPGLLEQYEQLVTTPVWQFYMTAFFYATSIIGAIYMLKMKKIGFHIYTIAQLAILSISQFIMGGSLKPGVANLFLTLLFIGLYAIYYKKFTGLEEVER